MYIEKKINSRLALSGGVSCLLQGQVLDQRPGSLKALHRVLDDPRMVFLWTEVSGVIPGICRSFSLSLDVTAPSAHVTTGPTDTFNPFYSFTAPLSAFGVS